MEETLDKCNTFILFCSENSIISKSVKGEWHAAYQIGKEEEMDIIPVYEEESTIPKLLKPMLNVEFNKKDINQFIQNLRKRMKDIKTESEKELDLVELKRDFDYIGGLIRYKIVVKNTSGNMINQLDISLQITSEHIRIIRIKPDKYKKGEHATIPYMSPNQSESIEFYLEPLMCGTIPVLPILIYIDSTGETQFKKREPIMIISKCPPIIPIGEENVANVKKLYKSKDLKQQFKSFEIKQKPKAIFESLQKAIGSWAGNPVSEPIYKNHEPLSVEMFYYVLNKNMDPKTKRREQIIIKIKVDERKNVAILSVAAEENPTVIGIITHIWQLAEEAFQKSFKFKLKSLRCPYCGDSIENLVEKQEKVKCKYCKTTFEKSLLEKNI